MLEQEFTSHRQLTEYLDIPRSTLQYWHQRKERIDAAIQRWSPFLSLRPALLFFTEFVLAAHFVMTLLGPCGVRLVCRFLELTWLGSLCGLFLWASTAGIRLDGAGHRRVWSGRRPAVVGRDGFPRRWPCVRTRPFHPETCLVAIEPVSNFILLEQYQRRPQGGPPGRRPWRKPSAIGRSRLSKPPAMKRGGCVIILRKTWPAHHSPDLFHVQHEIVRGMSAPLSAKKRQAEKGVEEASQHLCSSPSGATGLSPGPSSSGSSSGLRSTAPDGSGARGGSPAGAGNDPGTARADAGNPGRPQSGLSSLRSGERHRPKPGRGVLVLGRSFFHPGAHRPPGPPV